MNGVDCVVIDNCVVSRFLGGVSIVPIKLAEKKARFDISSLEKITYGNRLKDNLVISKLINGDVEFDDLRSIN